MAVREWVSAEQLAQEFGVPLRSVYGWNAKGTGPRRIRVGRHVRYSRDDVEAWIAAQYANRVPAA